jgi:predicted RNase H-related nuclease YkuK (DUF458 family)
MFFVKFLERKLLTMDKSFRMKRPSGEYVDLDKIIKIVRDYITQDPNAEYEFTVGTDSQNFSKTKMVEVIAIHRVGHGGIFFYNIEYLDKISNLRQKINTETSRSLEIANGLLENLELSLMEIDYDINDFNIEFQIHCDIGKNGKTQTMIKEITAWVEAQGYHCLIKPDSYTASGIANKYSK